MLRIWRRDDSRARWSSFGCQDGSDISTARKMTCPGLAWHLGIQRHGQRGEHLSFFCLKTTIVMVEVTKFEDVSWVEVFDSLRPAEHCNLGLSWEMDTSLSDEDFRTHRKIRGALFGKLDVIFSPPKHPTRKAPQVRVSQAVSPYRWVNGPSSTAVLCQGQI